ncbi:aldolase/citrate lyase family protein [Polaribacter sp. P097]|uniref:aldolase/citrate lyase family protein n=1 Tax=Polaribacter sp. P097 TaxID=3117398 RepID=UPI002FE0BE97
MQSYFFIPASRLQNLKKIKKSKPNFIIIDFEDAIIEKDIDIYFKELHLIENHQSYWYRLPVRSDFDNDVDLKYIQKFKDNGINLIILPKLKSAAELITICEKFQDIKFIVLIEHPKLLLEMRFALMMDYNKNLKNIIGLALGSHDLTTFLNAKHEENQLDYPRKELLYIAKAYDFVAIDIASMEIFNKEKFNNEVKNGIDNGYNAKFIIHPKQLEWLKTNKQNEEDTFWAKNILSKLPENYNGEDFAPFVFNKEVIEKPHALKALEILKKNTK